MGCSRSINWFVTDIAVQCQFLSDVHRAVHRNIISVVKPSGCTNVKLKQSHCRHGVAQRVPGS